MKKLYRYCCLLLFASLSALSCTEYDVQEPFAPAESSLDAKGKSFMDAFKTRPDWEREWQEICATGTPLPNEVVYLSFLGTAPTDVRAVLPVVADGKITRFVFFPLRGLAAKTRNADDTSLVKPEIMDEQAVNESPFARNFLRTSTIGQWEEKGYKTTFKLTPSEVPHTHEHVQTRSDIPDYPYEAIERANHPHTHELTQTQAESAYPHDVIEIANHPFAIAVYYDYYYSVYSNGYDPGIFARLDGIMDEMVWYAGGFSGPGYFALYSGSLTLWTNSYEAWFENSMDILHGSGCFYAMIAFIYLNSDLYAMFSDRFPIRSYYQSSSYISLTRIETMHLGGCESWLLPTSADPPPPTEPTYEEKITNFKNDLINSLGDLIQNVKNKLLLELSGVITDGNIAELEFTIGALFNSAENITLKMPTDLNDMQLKLVLGHEIAGHLALLEISRNAGSATALGGINQELMTLFNIFGYGDINGAHHNYIGSHIDEYEERLRQAFPGEADEFYEYGKWGGGLFNSPTFEAIPKEEQDAVEQYLRDNGLLNK